MGQIANQILMEILLKIRKRRKKAVHQKINVNGRIPCLTERINNLEIF